MSDDPTSEERSAVVAWLRERAQQADVLAEGLRLYGTGDRGRAIGAAQAYRTAAEAIEQGRHRG